MLEEQIRAMNLQMYVDDNGVKLDNILVRRLYYTLLLPCDC